MSIQRLFFSVSIYLFMNPIYASYNHTISDTSPVLESFQNDYKTYFSRYKQWIETGYSEKDGQRYPHLSSFIKESEDQENTPPTIIIRDI